MFFLAESQNFLMVTILVNKNIFEIDRDHLRCRERPRTCTNIRGWEEKLRIFRENNKMIIFIILTDVINISLASAIFWLLLLSLPIVCQIGYLFSSMIKRKIDIKDFSNFLGSHGGFLDRLDSIIAAAFYINILFILELL